MVVEKNRCETNCSSSSARATTQGESMRDKTNARAVHVTELLDWGKNGEFGEMCAFRFAFADRRAKES